ncbi:MULTISPECIES: acyltransferase [Methylomonas]|uniref:Acyltransferase n=1 Tax=Methylomonas koyamae TaxID=702114 RepID=A0A177PES4_9GAMM|nr:acyltransferase [Methylomonas koyamae]OAI28334.1 hypothetical protein A1355_01235 [Methylomonas koyamae]
MLIEFIRQIRDRRHIKNAISKGMIVGERFRAMGKVNYGSEPYLIRIGNHVTLSFEVCFITHDGGTWVYRDRYDELADVTRYGPIRIYDNCFIGARAIIMPNVKIGPNSLVAAGAVVTKDVPPNSVYGGVPAKLIMTYDQYVAKCSEAGQRVSKIHKRQRLLKMFDNFLNG